MNSIKRRLSRLLVISATVATVLTCITVVPAHAQTNYQLWFYHSQKCVDLQYGNATPGAKVQQWDCANPGNPNFGNQQWQFHFYGSAGFAEIRYAHADDICLLSFGPDNGSAMTIGYCSLNRPYAGWRGTMVQDGGIDYYIMQNADSRRCLDMPRSSTANGTQLQIWDCVPGNRQQWLSWAVDKP